MPDMEEIWDKMKSDDETLDKQVYVEEGHIVINVEYEYNIELGRCDTYEKILAWVMHLSVKTWMTQKITRRFVNVALREAKLAITPI
jgi:hypothetical protein